MEQGTRELMLGRLVDAIGAVEVGHPTRDAGDGAPASGKTTLADELAGMLRTQGRHVVRASVDDFLFPRAARYRRGEYSGEGCYCDTHDNESLKRVLLDPLGPGGDLRFRGAVYDRTGDPVVNLAPETAPVDAVLLFDGVFLMRPELNDRWELRILMATAFELTVGRAVVREGGAAGVERRWRERYAPAQQLYFAAVRPDQLADFVVHNDDPQRPAWESAGR